MGKHYVLYWIYKEGMTNPLNEGYIGVSGSIKKRVTKHFNELQKGTHCNNYLLNVWNKHQNLKIKILLRSLTKDDAYKQEFIYRPTKEIGYNLVPGGGNPPICTSVSLETRKKMSIAHKGKTFSEESKRKMSKSKKKLYQKEGNPFYSKNHTEISKQKMSQKHKARYTEEYRKTVSERQTGKGLKKIICIETGIVYDGPKNASKFLGLKSDSGIVMVCKGQRKTAGGYTWNYYKEN